MTKSPVQLTQMTLATTRTPEMVETAGGIVESTTTDSLARVILRDPDGNTIEVTQA